MTKLIILLLSIFILNLFFNGYLCSNKESTQNEKYPTLENIVKGYGYPYENHTVYTDDGWILTVGRIPYEPNRGACLKKRGTIVFSHGIYNNGALFVYLGPHKSLGLILANMCYDIWLLNARGTRYTKHKNFTENDKEYWNFSVDEMAMYDTSANIKYITKATGEQKVHFIGFSQGTSQIVALLAAKPEYQNNILSTQLVAPVFYISNFKSFPDWLPLSLLSQIVMHVPELITRPFPDSTGILQDMILNSCKPEITQVCLTIMYAFFDGPGNDQWVVHFPELISLKILAHFIQFHVTDKLQMFNYNIQKNLEMYGSANPPPYTIEKIHCPVYIYNALGDIVSTPLDVKKLAQSLPNLKNSVFINRTDFGHTSFNDFNENITKLFHRHLFDALGQYD